MVIKLNHCPYMLNIKNQKCYKNDNIIKICFNKIITTCQNKMYYFMITDDFIIKRKIV
jgi:hypothetical protein